MDLSYTTATIAMISLSDVAVERVNYHDSQGST